MNKFPRRAALLAALVFSVPFLVTVASDHAVAQPPADAKAQSAQSGGQAAQPAAVNRFNRLMKSKEERNMPPPQDGIHDPAGPGAAQLQPPREAFTSFANSNPKINAGNYVNWVQSLKEGVITPRFNKDDPKEEAVVFDLDIVREVKGSMPDVVYPHDRHTMWLDCSNCHPDLFVPEKGKNQISMAQILLGQKCGVCHGKVAFPVSECRLCHSKPKAQQGAAGGAPAANTAKAADAKAADAKAAPAADAKKADAKSEPAKK